MYDGDRPNHKVVAVPLTDPAWQDVTGVDDLPGDLKDEITHFFSVYTDLEGKDWRLEGWGSGDDAWEEIAAARDRHRAEE